MKVDLRRRANTPSLYGGDWENVTFEAIYISNQMLRFVVRKQSTLDVAILIIYKL